MTDNTATLETILDLTAQLSTSDQQRLIALLAGRLQAGRLQVGRLQVGRLQNEISPDQEPIDLLTTIGLGADVWQTVNVDDYLNAERDTWET